jgi:hypothetical protein
MKKYYNGIRQRRRPLSENSGIQEKRIILLIKVDLEYFDPSNKGTQDSP